MIRLLLVVLTVLSLAAWPSCSRLTRPVPALCSPICMTPCTGADGDTGVRWSAAADDPAAFDGLAGDVVPALADRLRVCEVRRQACEQCLRRLDKARVIKL